MSILVNRLAVEGEDFSSDSIETVGYNREDKTLYVQFNGGWNVYSYGGVEESTYNLFIQASSLNRFWRENISPKFTKGPVVNDDFEFVNETVEVSIDPADPDAWLYRTPEENRVVAGLPPLTGSRYSVAYSAEDLNGQTGHNAEPVFDAVDENDALRQFHESIKVVSNILGWTDYTIKIRSVTHHFE